MADEKRSDEFPIFPFLKTVKAEVKPIEQVNDGPVITGVLIKAGEDYDGNIFTEEFLRDIASQARNLKFENGSLTITGPIKDGKIAIE